MIFVTIVIFLLPSRRHYVDLNKFSPTREIIETALATDSHQCYISPFDDLFLEISSRYGNHWCLMSAIAYVESRFNPAARSYSGAMGLMQIMPRTATSYSLEHKSLYDPRVNITTGNIHYNAIERMLDIPDSTSMRDRISLILAGYNGGVGRVFDAQRIARVVGDDPHLWGSVAAGLMKLNDPEWYHRDTIVRFGRYSAPRETIQYVNDVLTKYDEYLAHTKHCPLYLLPIGEY